MAEGVNVRFTGELQRFIQERTGDSGLYSSASEYIRDLVRRDYLREEQRKWHWLRKELRPGMEASESEFVPLGVDSLLSEAKDRRSTNLNGAAPTPTVPSTHSPVSDPQRKCI